MLKDAPKFQFHKGSIKTRFIFNAFSMSSCFNSIKVRLRQAFFLSDGNELRFQFHKGSIKTSCRSRSCSRTTSFNSIKVRLRRLPLQGSCDSSDRFQFHKGSIKTRLQAVYQLPSRSFNSIKVRLRHVLSSMLSPCPRVSIP